MVARHFVYLQPKENTNYSSKRSQNIVFGDYIMLRFLLSQAFVSSFEQKIEFIMLGDTISDDKRKLN